MCTQDYFKFWVVTKQFTGVKEQKYVHFAILELLLWSKSNNCTFVFFSCFLPDLAENERARRIRNKPFILSGLRWVGRPEQPVQNDCQIKKNLCTWKMCFFPENKYFYYCIMGRWGTRNTFAERIEIPARNIGPPLIWCMAELSKIWHFRLFYFLSQLEADAPLIDFRIPGGVERCLIGPGAFKVAL